MKGRKWGMGGGKVYSHFQQVKEGGYESERVKGRKVK